MERVQKIIAHAGICSRRKAEQLIEKRLVTVNGKIISLGDKADPVKDVIRVKNRIIALEKKVYYMVHKPVGYITTCYDPKMNNTIFALPEVKKLKLHSNLRLYPVGRLDKDSSGLLIITNDGDFANKIMHPRYEIEKTYIVALHKPIIRRDLQRIRSGVIVDKQKTWPAKAQRLSPAIVKLTIHEGRNRIVRRMFQQIGYNVVTLKRISICSLQLDIGVGEVRMLQDEEVTSLLENKPIV